MKAFLMHRDRDFAVDAELPAQRDELVQDLELGSLIAAMGRDDEVLTAVAERAILLSLGDREAIAYRQAILRDCLEGPDIVRELYDIAVTAVAAERKILFGLLSSTPELTLHRSVELLDLLVVELRRLRAVADEHRDAMRSEGFQRLLDMVHAELDDEYFGVIDGHLRALRFSGGVLTSARLGAGNKGTGYVLRRASNPNPGWRDRLSTLVHPEGLAFTIPDRDEAGARALSDLRDRGVDLVANALAQATEHVRSFFMMLRVELAFYVGCLNLHDTLAQLDQPVCEPEPLDGGATFAAEGLYDASLALKLGGGVVANDVDGADKDLIMITGANQGGKSTFLRSVGVAQLMLQAGMFAPATALRASVASGVFTHFKREEDATMRSGKLDEELRRMSAIADRLAPRGLVLFNESFAATNEREGSEIARQVIRALLDAGVRVVFVTHMFDLADTAYQRHSDRILFLRAERGEDGRRPFQLVPARPLPTSYGEDVYREIFGEDEPDAGAPPQAA